MPPPMIIAAVVAADSSTCDAPVARVAATLRAEGRKVRGLVQVRERGDDCDGLSLVDIETGTRYPITQNLGPGSHSCALDPALVAVAGNVIQHVVGGDADLVVFNRFGGLEASGGGLRAEMATLMTAGTPVLVIVSGRNLAAWRHFTAGLADELPPDDQQLLDWCRRAIAAHTTPTPTQTERP